MGFLGDLGKGFVRSAVNQVGRDTGKVFSNQIYGDAHSTPIRNVSRTGSVYFNESTKEEISEEELMKMIKDEGYKTRYITHGVFHHILTFGGLFILTFIFSETPIAYILITLAAVAFKFANIPNAVYARKESVPIYSSDRRYKRGYRIDGFSKETVKYKMPATAKQMKINAIISILYLALCSFVSFYGVTTGNDFHHYSVLVDHEKFLKDSAKIKQDIEYWNGKDSAAYNREITEFNRKYQEAIDYIKKSDSIKALKGK